MSNKQKVSKEILAVRNKLKTKEYFQFGFGDSSGKIEQYTGGCFANASGKVFKGCEAFFDRGVCSALKKNGYITGYTRDIQEFPESDIAYLNYCVNESPWSDVYMTDVDDIIKKGGLYRTDMNNQFVLEAAYVLRNVYEGWKLAAAWYELAKQGYNKTAALLFHSNPNIYYGGHRNIWTINLGKKAGLALINNDRSSFENKEELYMNKGMAKINGMETIWKQPKDSPIVFPPFDKPAKEWGGMVGYKDEAAAFEKFCKDNKWPVK